jgi:hypothetical protein
VIVDYEGIEPSNKIGYYLEEDFDDDDDAPNK